MPSEISMMMLFDCLTVMLKTERQAIFVFQYILFSIYCSLPKRPAY